MVFRDGGPVEGGHAENRDIHVVVGSRVNHAAT